MKGDWTFSNVERRDMGKRNRDAGHSNCLLLFLAAGVCFLASCIPGCSRSEETSSETHLSPLAQSIFSNSGEPLNCYSRCIPATLAIARGGLGLDPKEQEDHPRPYAKAIFESLEKESRGSDSAITRVPVDKVIAGISEGPAVPTILVHKSGHLYVLFGAIRVNDRLLCQVVHGSEPVSLVTKQAMLQGSFREAWRLKKAGQVGIPIHVGNAVVTIDKLWHNFGETFPGNSLECAFHLTNVGDVTAILDRPISSCQCTVSNVNETTILSPDKSLDIHVVTKSDRSTSLRHSVGLMFYETKSGTSRLVQLALIGSQRELMQIVPSTVDFGAIGSVGSVSRTVRLTESPSDRFVLQRVDTGTLPLHCTIDGTKAVDGLSTYRVHCVLDPVGLKPDTYEGALHFLTDRKLGPDLYLPVTFRVTSPIECYPSMVSFGTVTVKDKPERRVHVTSCCGPKYLTGIVP